jgi:hypothetical protein
VPDLHGESPADSREFYEKVLGSYLVMDQGWVVTFVASGDPAAQITVMPEDASAPVNPDVSIEVDDTRPMRRSPQLNRWDATSCTA